MSIEESILEKVRALPLAKNAEVLQYVSGLGAAESVNEECLAASRREVWGTFSL